METLEQQKEIAAANLKEAKEILDSLNVPFCLFLGSALGAYRDKDFCKGDVDDIDIAVRIDYFNRIDEIREKFKEKGFNEYHFWNEPDGIAPEVAFRKEYDGWYSKIDVFFITPVDNKIAWRFYARPIQTRLVNNYFEEFDTVEFYGTTYNIPHPIQEYLKENYGQMWAIPIPRDQWNWEKDNKCEIQ